MLVIYKADPRSV